jgi:hypothetical protein
MRVQVANGVLFIPAGVYRINDTLDTFNPALRRPFVIKGAGWWVLCWGILHARPSLLSHAPPSWWAFQVVASVAG